MIPTWPGGRWSEETLCKGPSAGVDPGGMCWSKLRSWLVQGKMWKMCRKTLVFIPKKGPFQPVRGCFFFQGQAATYLLNKGIVRKVRSLSLQLVGRKLRVLAVRKTPSFEGQFRNSKFWGPKNLETWTFEGPHLEHSHCLRFKNQPHKLTCNRLQAQTLLGTGSAICFPDLWGCLRKQTPRSRKAGFYNYVCLCLFRFPLSFAVLCFPCFAYFGGIHL